jgi:cell division protein FtsL
MLAEKQVYAGNTQPWREPAPEIRELPKHHVRKSAKPHSYKLFRRRMLISAIVIVAIYSIAVVRSATLVNTGARLISLQQQEAQLIMKNNELKIEVEKLKEPERITTIAEKQLGMSVARNNIYVKAKTN